MNWVTYVSVFSLINVFFIIAVYIYIYLNKKQNFIPSLAIALFAYTALLIWETFFHDMDKAFLYRLVENALGLISTFFFIKSISEYLDKTFNHIVLLLIFCGLILFSGFSNLFLNNFVLANIPVYLLVCISYFSLGVLLIKDKTYGKKASAFTGIILLLWGLNILLYPITSQIEAFVPFGFLLSSLFILLTGVSGVFMHLNKINYLRKQKKLDEKLRSYNFSKIFLFYILYILTYLFIGFTVLIVYFTSETLKKDILEIENYSLERAKSRIKEEAKRAVQIVNNIKESFPNDIEKQQAEAIKKIGRWRYKGDNYVFGATYEGVSILGPSVGENVLDITDENGLKIVENMIRIAKEGGGFIRYKMPNSNSHASQKISYVLPVPDWEWYLGAGLPINTVQELASKKRKSAQKALIALIALIAFLFVGAAFIIYFTSLYISHAIGKDIKLFRDFFSNVVYEKARLKTDHFTIKELKEIAKAANEMAITKEELSEKLKEKDKRLKIASEAIKDGTWEWNIDEGKYYLTEGFYKMFGYEEGDFNSDEEAWNNIMTSDTKFPSIVENILYGDEKTISEERKFKNKNGDFTNVLIHAKEVLEEKKRKWIGVNISVKEMRETEFELKEKLEFYKSIYKNLGGAVFVLDKMKIIDTNEKALLYLRTTQSDVLGKTPVDFSPKYQPDGRESLEKAEEIIKKVYNGETRNFFWQHLRHDGSMLDCEITLNKIKVNEEEFLLALIKDVNEKTNM